MRPRRSDWEEEWGDPRGGRDGKRRRSGKKGSKKPKQEFEAELPGKQRHSRRRFEGDEIDPVPSMDGGEPTDEELLDDVDASYDELNFDRAFPDDADGEDLGLRDGASFGDYGMAFDDEDWG